ncbi:MAG: hypothetical protein VB084_11945 [Syntrophomonadaceae bacterium]|nr:hypothetical protein [Syntrophomonadaceae bacterium]
MLIQTAMSARGEAATAFVPDGEETIEGEFALISSVGEKPADEQKFTALYHYTVTDSGNVITSTLCRARTGSFLTLAPKDKPI